MKVTSSCLGNKSTKQINFFTVLSSHPKDVMIISKVSQPLRGKCSAGQEGCHGKRVVLLAELGERNTGVRT